MTTLTACPIHGSVPLDTCSLCRRSKASTYLVRSGMSPTITADGQLHCGDRGPDIYAHVRRRGLRVEWEITAGRTGEPLAFGATFTSGGADVKARAAAHRPGVGKAVAS